MIEGCPSSLVEIVLTVVASEDVIAQDGGTLKLGERGGLAVRALHGAGIRWECWVIA